MQVDAKLQPNGSYESAIKSRHGAARRSSGFTLLELITAMAIVAILSAFALPMLQSSSTTTESNLLLNTVQFARSAAIKQGANVVVCPSSNPTATTPTCSTSTSWKTGWIVLTAANGQCGQSGGATGDQVLSVQPAFTSTDTATFNTIGTNTNTSLCFNKYGFSPSGYTGYVQLDAKAVNLKKRRCMILSGVGHAQVVTSGQYDAPNLVQCPAT